MRQSVFIILFVFGLFLLIPPVSGAGIVFMVLLIIHYYWGKYKEMMGEDDGTQAREATTFTTFESESIKIRPDIKEAFNRKDYQDLQRDNR